ncbi:MAG: hypothetical protein H7836_07690 [Magnetococcus sp. YQC-3]
MSNNRTLMALCIVLDLVNSAVAQAEAEQPPAGEEKSQWEVHGVLKNETAFFNNRGQTTNQANSAIDQSGHGPGSLVKFENSLNLFLNRQFSETSSLHAQFNLLYDAKGLEGAQLHEFYSQNDYLRELYLDTTVGPVDVRLGKQQEVWGTADGIKLLDILNPTDYREFVQNTLADSRIPVWMMKLSGTVGGTGNVQFVLAQPKENHVPGLNAGGDAGDVFVMQGVDAITGRVNGFLNIVPQMGRVANTFNGMMGNLLGMTNISVGDFVAGQGAAPLNQAAQFTNRNQTRLIDGEHWDPGNPHAAFEYMNNATFATFGSFVDARSAFRQDLPNDLALNVGMRYKNSVGGNFNYSFNYLNHYDPNPYITLSWENLRGNPLGIERVVDGGYTTINLRDAAGNYAGAGNPAVLVFTEKMKRINSLGGSFDTSIETKALGPVVLRGETVLQLGTQTPVVDRGLLSQGDLVGALQSKSTDMLKYVLGAEFIVMTNLTIGGQFIQFINLDYVDVPGNGPANSGRYTADQAVMNMSNGLRKGEEFKNFGSLLLSKPIGTEQQGRINNLTMVEGGGGWWNRLDGEWKLNDNWVTMAEWNQYWGDADTLFGQFFNSSNVQVGVKYLF